MKEPSIEWEVCKFYWNLYQKQDVEVDLEEIKRMTGHMKTISDVEKAKLEIQIIISDVSQCLKNTRNNVAPGSGGFSGAFGKVFWRYLKKVVRCHTSNI